MSDHGREPSLPGMGHLTPQQLLFVVLAQQYSTTRDVDRYILLNDNHSPGTARIMGMIENSEDVARMFNILVDSGYNPPNKCSMW